MRFNLDKKGDFMPKKIKTFNELHPHEETKFEPLSKKQSYVTSIQKEEVK